MVAWSDRSWFLGVIVRGYAEYYSVMVTLSGRPWLHWVVVHGYIEWSAMVTLDVNGYTK